MSSRPPEPVPRTDSEPIGKRDEALFRHLFASRPAQQRRIGPWLVAAVLHIPLAYFFVTSEMGQRVIRHAEFLIRPVLTADDNPPALPAPITIVPVEEPTRPEPARAAGSPAAQPQLPAPGLPNPNALVTPPAAAGTAVGTPGGGNGGSVLDRMAAPVPDPRLLSPTDPSSLLTGPEAARARIAERIGQLNDSIAAERLAEARATDWTVTDKDGKRWGVSPGKLHLGDITIPLPLAFATAPGRRDEANDRVRDWNEIEAQSSRAEISDNFKDRVKEIRKRKEQERAARIADKNGDKKKSGSN